MRSIALPLALVVLAASPAAGQEEERYQLERTEDGYVRLDTRTGEMTRCREDGTELICQPAVDQRSGSMRDDDVARDTAGLQDETATDEELDRLRNSIEALEQRIEALEAAKPVAVLPTEQEFERSMDYAERFIRRFMGVVKELDDKQPDSSDEPSPDRT